jgi:hypothetical protein
VAGRGSVNRGKKSDDVLRQSVFAAEGMAQGLTQRVGGARAANEISGAAALIVLLFDTHHAR